MIRKITDMFREKEKTFSLEFFPPKTPEGVEKLYKTVDELNQLGPDFASVTYGAGGSTRGTTMDICVEIQKRFDLTVMHHFTCVGQSKPEMKEIIQRMKENSEGFEYCYQLIDLIREIDRDFFSIGVAGFPEGHINCPDKETDSKYLKIKMDHGGDFVITQLFFENRIYSEYLERLKNTGVNIRILPGIIPITSYEGLIRFCNMCGATITQEVHDIFRPISGDEEATRKAGIEFAVKQCLDLLERGAPGLHFFTLNKVEPTREIWNRLALS
jgi:methylenetetrahydrofolate reductase (NADPH)